jgi:hypothetical protein
MAWVRFLRAFTYTRSADRRVSTCYAAGHAVSVRSECRREALACGAAEPFPTPKSGDGRVQVSANGVRYIPPESL